MKDHEKENSEDCDSDFFQTPMKNPEDFDQLPAVDRDSISEYFSIPSDDSDKTPVPRKSEYSLRSTLLREACLSGKKPLKEARQSLHFGGRKGRKSMSVKKGQANKVALASLENAMNVQDDSSFKRETYDLTTITQAIDEINTTLDKTTVADVTINGNVDDSQQKHETMEAPEEQQQDMLDVNNLMSEDEEDFKSADTVVENVPPSNEPETTLNRSSYVVTSPVVAKAVHFNSSRTVVEFSSRDSSKIGDSLDKIEDEPEVTPKTTSNTGAKIRSRKATPAINGVNIPPRFKNYIQRLSKTPTSDSEGSASKKDKAAVAPEGEKKGVRFDPNVKKGPEVTKKPTMPSKGTIIAGPSKRTTIAGPSKGTVIAGPSKRTTIAGPSKGTIIAAPPKRTSNPKPKIPAYRNSMRLPARTTAPAAAAPKDKKPAVKRTSYHSMAEMQSTVLLRHFSPDKRQVMPTPSKAKPKLTKPRGPKLLTEERAKQHLMVRGNILATIQESVDGHVGAGNDAGQQTALAIKRLTKPGVIARSRPPTYLNPKARRPPTKATTPVFLTDVRRAQWDQKLKKADEKKQSDDAALNTTVFRARPAPNFKRVVAPGKLVSSGTVKRSPIKMRPFSFEQREKEKKEKATNSALTSGTSIASSSK